MKGKSVSYRRRARDAHTGSRDKDNGRSRPPGYGRASCAERCLGRKLADRRGLHRPGVNRSSAPSGQGISCENGHDQLGGREAGKGGFDSDGEKGFDERGFRLLYNGQKSAIIATVTVASIDIG